METIYLNVIDQAHAIRKLLFCGIVLGVLDYGQALLKSADVGRIVREGVIGKASSAVEILREKYGDYFLREAKVGEAFAIRFADKMICAQVLIGHGRLRRFQCCALPNLLREFQLRRREISYTFTTSSIRGNGTRSR